MVVFVIIDDIDDDYFESDGDTGKLTGVLMLVIY